MNKNIINENIEVHKKRPYSGSYFTYMFETSSDIY